jgi:hypothetical protein
MKFIKVLLFLGLVQNVYAGDSGHGGDGVACFRHEGLTLKDFAADTEKYEHLKSLGIEDSTEYKGEIYGDSSQQSAKLILNGGFVNSTGGTLANASFILVDSGGKLGVTGPAILQSLITREHYKSLQKINRTGLINQLQSLPQNEVLDYFYDLFAMAKGFDQIYSQVREPGMMGRIEDGLFDVNGLPDVDDAGRKLLLPNNCIELQVVYREGVMLTTDPVLWENLGIKNASGQLEFNNFEKALMQIHEELYFYGSTQVSPNHTNSINTQNLLVELLTTEIDSADKLRSVLFRHGFPN